MAIERNDTNERQARLDAMIDEFGAAQQRQFVKRGIAPWKRTEAAHQAMAWGEPLPPEKLH